MAALHLIHHEENHGCCGIGTIVKHVVVKHRLQELKTIYAHRACAMVGFSCTSLCSCLLGPPCLHNYILCFIT